MIPERQEELQKLCHDMFMSSKPQRKPRDDSVWVTALYSLFLNDHVGS